ncbi:hypothetical protein KSP39_PZI005208 [Platanthera zijinensis]|uniref:Protein BIG GRAIN 1-like n=1 Tax=Platanthera zijinensis TaxID=2320716 RepID=A0AAP0BTE8_9ASPA
MEGRQAGARRSPPTPSPPPRRYWDYPSFSSTLLDAIYRSIDDTDGVTKRPSGAPDPISSRKKNAGGLSERKKHLPPVIFPGREQSGRRRWTSSSSDGSSYGGFSSSDPESISAAQPVGLRPIRTTPSSRTARFRSADDGKDPPIPSRVEEKRAKKERHGSIRSRLRDLTNGGAAPSSPGARLANFLNSMFAGKSKVSAVSSCAAAPSYSHSCLKRTHAATGKRTVRFSPVSVIVGDDCSPYGEKYVCGGDRTPAVRSAEAVEEDAGSDSSSDLFELKNLACVGRLRDELPVYDTTRLGNYGCISRSLTKISTKTLEKDKYKERS